MTPADRAAITAATEQGRTGVVLTDRQLQLLHLRRRVEQVFQPRKAIA